MENQNWHIECSGIKVGSLQSLIMQDEGNEQVKGISIAKLPDIRHKFRKLTMKERQIEAVHKKRFKELQETKIIIRYKKNGKKITKVVFVKDLKLALITYPPYNETT